MGPKRIALLAGLSLVGSFGLTEASIASAAGPHARPFAGHQGHFRPSPGGHLRHGWGTRRHGSASHWGWGLGLAIGVPWALGWYDPWRWGPVYAPPYYSYGPAYRNYGALDGCGPDEECWRERLSAGESSAPTTIVAPPAPGEEGGPTQRPLYLNYCDSAKAWFPQVRTCPGGWRVIRPAYAPAS